jgi:hypothetical protein
MENSFINDDLLDFIDPIYGSGDSFLASPSEKKLPKQLINSHSTLSQYRNYYKKKIFEDNLSFFRALELFFLRQDAWRAHRSSERRVMNLYARYVHGTKCIPAYPPAHFPGVRLEEMNFLETIFQIKILVYSKDWLNDGIPKRLFESDKAEFDKTLLLDLTSSHFSLVGNKSAYLCHYPCLKCKRIFNNSNYCRKHKCISRI